MKKISIPVLLTIGAILLIGAAASRTPILRGFLQSNFDGNGYAITNLGGLISHGSIVLQNSVLGFTTTGMGTSNVIIYSPVFNQIAFRDNGTTNDMFRMVSSNNVYSLIPASTNQTSSTTIGTSAKPFTESYFSNTVVYSLLAVQGNAVVTNGLFVIAPTNDLAPPPSVLQPIGLFGALEMSITNTVSVANTTDYYTLTNYNEFHTNGFVANQTGGYLTNVLAGFYGISFYCSAVPGNGDVIEAAIFVNDVIHNELTIFGAYDNPARIRGISLRGTHYLAANSRVSLRFRNYSGTSTITVWRANLVLGTP